MRLQFIKPYEVETAFGAHRFEAGDLIEVDQVEDVHQLLLTGHAVQHTRTDILKILSRMSVKDLAQINRVLVTFGGRIVDVTTPEIFEITQCSQRPAPYGLCTHFDMKLDRSDMTLSPYCKRSRKFCLTAASRTEGNQNGNP